MVTTALRTVHPAETRQAYVPKHGRGQLRPFRIGESGNPTGKGGLFYEAQQICREASPEAARRMVELMGSKDERVALMAADKILERAWGRPKQVADDAKLDPAVDERYAQMRAKIMAMLERIERAKPLPFDSEQ
jgi:hypothetical protein